MGSVRDSRFEARIQMDRRNLRVTPAWSDLPEGILGIVIKKLSFLDQISVISVCKNWRASKDFVRNSECHPWVMTHSSACTKSSNSYYSFECELFHPCSPNKVHAPVIKSVGRRMNPNHSWLYPLASTDGWALLGGKDSMLFLYNPFTNKVIETDLEATNCYTILATILGSPSDPDHCKIFTASVRSDFDISINTYCLSSKSLQSVLVGKMTNGEHANTFYSVLYMKDKLYCLFKNGRLHSYTFEDKEWKLLTEGFGNPYVSWRNLSGGWLMEIEEKLVLVCNMRNPSNYDWMIFRFDWTAMAWVAETSLTSCVFFIFYNAAWSAPWTDCHGKKLQGCRLYYHDFYHDVVGELWFEYWHSLIPKSGTNDVGEAVTRLQSGQSNWYYWTPRRYRLSSLCFVQPPYSGI